jgi:hypothetical protein
VHQAQLAAQAEALPSLHDLIARWLERTPFIIGGGGGGGGGGEAEGGEGMSSLWEHYREGVKKMLEADRTFVLEEAKEVEERIKASTTTSSSSSSSSTAAASASASTAAAASEEPSSAGAVSSDDSSSGGAAACPMNNHASGGLPPTSSSTAPPLSAAEVAKNARAAKVAKQLEEIDARGEALNTILDPVKFEEAREKGEVRKERRR